MDRLISEQAVIDAIDKWVKNMGVLIALPANEVTPLFESIHELPSVNPQEPKTDVLDEIRAEIDAHRETLKIMADDDWYAGKIRGYDCAIEIINKYRESEVSNAGSN